MKRTVVRFAPWIVTAGVLVFLFATINVHDVVHSFHDAATWVVPVLVGVVSVIFVADSFAFWKTISWFTAPITFTETLVVRGAAYPLSLLNYTVGQGAFAWFLHRTRGVPLLRCAATVLLIMGINLLALLVLASVGLASGAGALVPPVIRRVLLAAYAGLAVYAVLVALKPSFLTKQPVLDILLTAGLGGHLRALVVRLPHIAALVASSILSLRAFGVAVPVVQALLLLPIVYFIGVLPISVQGLGTSQAIMVLLFQKYAPPGSLNPRSMVLAAGLCGQMVATCVQLTIGLICSRTAIWKRPVRSPASVPSPSEG